LSFKEIWSLERLKKKFKKLEFKAHQVWVQRVGNPIGFALELRKALTQEGYLVVPIPCGLRLSWNC